MVPTMSTKLRRDELNDKSYSSGYDIYHLVDSSDDDTEISKGDTDISIQ